MSNLNIRYVDLYSKKIFFELRKELCCNNVHLVPALEKIVINMGIGSAVYNSKAIQNAAFSGSVMLDIPKMSFRHVC